MKAPMNSWIPFRKRHPPESGFYLVSITSTHWDKVTSVQSIAVKPFSMTLRKFYGFKADPEWDIEVDAWQELPEPFIKE